MRLSKIVLYIVSISLNCLVASCNFNHEEHSEEAHEEHEEIPKDILTLSSLQIKAAEIRLGSFEQKSLSRLVKASGILDLPPQNKAGVSSLIGGKITKINVIQGDKVKIGQVLALIENPEIIQVQKDYLEAKSEFGYSEQEYLRQKELYQEKIVAGKKYQAALADYQAKKALIASLENQLRQFGISPSNVSGGNFTKTIPVTTPISGYVTTIAVKTGSYIDPTQEIFTVVDNDHIHVDLQVFEKDVPKVKQGQKIFFTIRGTDNVYTAKIFSVGKAFDETTRSVPVHAEIVDHQNHNLLPGMYVDGRIEVGQEKVTALPEEAVVKDGSKNFIFIQLDSIPSSNHHNEGGKEKSQKEEVSSEEEIIFKKVQVKTGVSDLGYTQVVPLEKVSSNSKVVISGAYFLSGQMKNEQGGGEDSHGH